MKGYGITIAALALFMAAGTPIASADDPSGETHSTAECTTVDTNTPQMWIAEVCRFSTANGSYVCLVWEDVVLFNAACLVSSNESIWFCQGQRVEGVGAISLHDCEEVSTGDIEESLAEILDQVPPLPQITCLPPEGICIEDGDDAAGTSASGGAAVPVSFHPPEGSRGRCFLVYVDYSGVQVGPAYICALIFDERPPPSTVLGICTSFHDASTSGGVCTFVYHSSGSPPQVCSGYYRYFETYDSWEPTAVVCT